MQNVLNNTILNSFFGSSGTNIYGYEIENSALFNGATAHLRRTPSSSGDVKTWSFGTWFKRSELNTSQHIMQVYTAGSDYVQMVFQADNTIDINFSKSTGVKLRLITYPVIRDTNSFQHFVFTLDTSLAIPAYHVYLNGDEIVDFSTETNNLTQNMGFVVNEASEDHAIFGQPFTTGYEFNGYAAQTFLIDGTAVDISDVGEYSSVIPSLWTPKDISGLTYGTNGFLLDFSNALDLGADVSGQGNDFTVNGSPEQTSDTPTSNKVAWDPLSRFGANAGEPTYSNGNKTLTFGTAQRRSWAGCPIPNDKKIYAEFLIGASSDLLLAVSGRKGQGGNECECYYRSNGQVWYDGGSTSNQSTFTTNDRIGIKIDTTTNTIEFLKNNVSQGSYAYLDPSTSLTDEVWFNPWAGAGGAGDTVTCAFVEEDLVYDIPDGYELLDPSTWEDPDVLDTSDYYYQEVFTAPQEDLSNTSDAIASNEYSSFVASNAFDNNGGTYWCTTTSPGVIGDYIGQQWSIAKSVYSFTYTGISTDNWTTSVKIQTYDGSVWSDHETGIATIQSTAKQTVVLSSPAIDIYGIRIVAEVGNGYGNRFALMEVEFLQQNANKNITLPWDAESNDWLMILKNMDSAESWVWVNTKIGLDKYLRSDTVNSLASLSTAVTRSGSVVTLPDDLLADGDEYLVQFMKEDPDHFTMTEYEGTGAVRTVSHNGNSVPFMNINKNLSVGRTWRVQHKGIGPTKSGRLDDTAGFATSSTVWNDTEPTHLNVSLGTDLAVNEDTKSFIMFCWFDNGVYKPIDYTGNANVDGPFCYLGGRPQAIPMLKNADLSTTNWEVRSTAYDATNPLKLRGYANISNAFGTTSNLEDAVSNGIKLRSTYAAGNGSGNQIVGLAVLDQPLKYTNAR